MAIRVRTDNKFPQCVSCGTEAGTIDIRFYMKDNTTSATSVCLCAECRKVLLDKLNEFDDTKDHKMTIIIERDKAFKLLCACTEIQYYFEGLAEHADDDDVREIHERNALEWRAIHDVLKAQIEKGGDMNEGKEV